MKYSLIIFCLMIISCKKQVTSPNNTIKYDTIEYDVTASNHGQIGIVYNNEKQQQVEGLFKSHWHYTINGYSKPFNAHLEFLGTPDINESIVLKILVGGNVVKTATLLGKDGYVWIETNLDYIVQ